MRKIQLALSAALLISAASIANAQAPPAPTIPADTAAALKQRAGKWTFEGSGLINGKQQSVSGTTDCKPFAGGVGLVCTWHEKASIEGSRRRIQLLGYDAQAKMTRFAELDNRGFANSDTASITPEGGTIHFSGTEDGKPMSGQDEIKVTSGGDEATEHVTVEVGGKRVVDVTMTHKKVKP